MFRLLRGLLRRLQPDNIPPNLNNEKQVTSVGFKVLIISPNLNKLNLLGGGSNF